MEIGLLWIAVMAELRFIESLIKTETVEVTGIIEVTVMVLASEKWLFEVILSLIDAALAVVTV